MKKVAITGALASGKTLACQFFQELGAYVVSADAIVNDLLLHDHTIQNKVVSLLGPTILQNGTINKKAIADNVFSHLPNLHALEQILHPAVFNEITRQYLKIQNNTSYNLFIAEIPLLYETNTDPLFDYVITVVAEEQDRKKYFIKRSQNTAEDFVKISQRQLPPEEKARRANYIVSNSGSKKKLRQEVIQVINKLRSI